MLLRISKFSAAYDLLNNDLSIEIISYHNIG